MSVSQYWKRFCIVGKAYSLKAMPAHPATLHHNGGEAQDVNP
ncbi:hypothetical protein Q9291_10875 [Methylophilus aquaticus]|uniref:Uncharacterized protein n=1 Tax=Methylophilus aquaticus TaxID=1971610 RepID=A0ABT9JUV5_9PROT|nr:hypothetical protein [Methylophilus aquaticus]